MTLPDEVQSGETKIRLVKTGPRLAAGTHPGCEVLLQGQTGVQYVSLLLQRFVVGNRFYTIGIVITDIGRSSAETPKARQFVRSFRLVEPDGRLSSPSALSQQETAAFESDGVVALVLQGQGEQSWSQGNYLAAEKKMAEAIEVGEPGGVRGDWLGKWFVKLASVITRDGTDKRRADEGVRLIDRGLLVGYDEWPAHALKANLLELLNRPIEAASARQLAAKRRPVGDNTELWVPLRGSAQAVENPARVTYVKQPVPSAEELSGAGSSLLPELVKQRLEIAEPSSLRERAKKVFALAEETRDDTVGQFFLANRALTMSANSLDVDSVLTVFKWITAHFEVDELEMRTEIFSKMAGRNLDMEAVRKVNRELRAAYKGAVDAERFDLATRLLSSALALARKSSNWPTVRELEKDQIELQKLKRTKTPKKG